MREYENKTFHLIKDRNLRLNEALVHSLQDVFTPIAAAFQIGTTMLFPDVNRFPLINELLKLCWAKCPQGVALSKLSCKELWVSDSTASQKFNESELPDNTSTNRDRTTCLGPRLGPNNSVPKDYRKPKTFTSVTHVCVSGHTAKIVRQKSHVSILIAEFGILNLTIPRPSVRLCIRGAGFAGSKDTRPSFMDHKTSTQPAIFARDFIKSAPFGKLTSPIFLRPDDAFGDRRSFFRADLLGSNRVFSSAETRLAGRFFGLKFFGFLGRAVFHVKM